MTNTSFKLNDKVPVYASVKRHWTTPCVIGSEAAATDKTANAVEGWTYFAGTAGPSSELRRVVPLALSISGWRAALGDLLERRNSCAEHPIPGLARFDTLLRRVQGRALQCA